MALQEHEAWVTLFHEKRTNAIVTIAYRLREELLYVDTLIGAIAA